MSDLLYLSTGEIESGVFHDTVILVNGKVEADASSLQENDTVLIIFRGMGLLGFKLDVSPPYWRNITVRTGCSFHRLCKGYASKFLCYIRPVVMSDNGLTITFTDKWADAILSSLTLNGKSSCICVQLIILK